MIDRVISFFKRLFTESKFPGRSGGYADKNVEEVYDVKTFDSNIDGKKLVVFDPKEDVKRGNKD